MTAETKARLPPPPASSSTIAPFLRQPHATHKHTTLHGHHMNPPCMPLTSMPMCFVMA